MMSPSSAWLLRLYRVEYSASEWDDYRLEAQPTGSPRKARVIYFGPVSGIWKEAPPVAWVDEEHLRFEGHVLDVRTSNVVVPDDPPAPDPASLGAAVDVLGWGLAAGVALGIVLLGVVALYVLPRLAARPRRAGGL
jgi:hypothetical protein